MLVELKKVIDIKFIFKKKPIKGGTPAIESSINTIIYFLTKFVVFLKDANVLFLLKEDERITIFMNKHNEIL